MQKVRHRFIGFPPHDERERRERAAFGCVLLVGAVWSVLLAGLVIAAMRWLWLSA